MNKNKLRRTLLWLQGLLMFFLVILFGFGVFYDRVLTKLEDSLAAHPVSEFDRKLATKIGKPFTKEDHRSLVEAVASGDEGTTLVAKAARSLAQASRNFSGLAIFLSLFSTFLLVRNLRNVGEIPPASPIDPDERS